MPHREEQVPLVVNQSSTVSKAPNEGYGSGPPDSLAVKITDTATLSPSLHVSYDYVLAFPHDAPFNASISKPDIVHRLHLAGLTTEEVVSKSAVFCKVRANVTRLQKEAARVNLPVLVDDVVLAEVAKTGLQAFHIESFEVENPPRQWLDLFRRPIYPPYSHIYMPYAKESDQSIYASHDGAFFSSIHRMQLIESILTNVNGGGAGLDLDLLTSEGVVIAAYPLHCDSQRLTLQKTWMAWCYPPWQQPLQGIRDYFGPKVALYFAFLGHFTTYVLWAALVGLAITTLQIAPSKVSMYVEASALTYVLPIFGVAMMLWACFFLKHWKRRNAVLALEWGMSDLDKHTHDMVLFRNRPNSRVDAVLRVGGSWLVLVVLMEAIVLAVGAVARLYVSPTWGYAQGNMTLLAGLIVAQIVALSTVFQWLCVKLNEYENHPTASAYERSFVLKLVLFEGVNHFAALVYFAFYVPMNPPDFAWLVYKVYGAYIVVYHCQRVLSRRRNNQHHPRNESGDDTDDDMEGQFALAEYGWKDSMLDHLRLVVHFAFVTVFAVLCPLNPFLSLVHYSLELRFNGAKLLTSCRRPRPRGAENLGIWYVVLHWVLNVAVVTNAWLLVSLYPTQPPTTPAPPGPASLAAISSQHVVLSLILCLVVCRMLVIVGYQDTPSRIRLQLERQAYYVAKLYHKAFGWPGHMAANTSTLAFEYCLAFPNPEALPKKSHSRPTSPKPALSTVLDALKKANLAFNVYPSAAKSSTYLSSFIFCEVRATESQLQQEAVRMQLPMLLDEIMLKELAHEGVFHALHKGMVDVVDRTRIEATRVNLLLLLENMLTQRVFHSNDYTNVEMADKLEKLLAALHNREPRTHVSLAHVLANFKELIEVDIEGEQFRQLDVPQTLLNRIETYLSTGDAQPTTPTSDVHPNNALSYANKNFDKLLSQMVASLHERPLNTLYMAQKTWKYGLEKVLWCIEELLKHSDVSVFELSSSSPLKWLSMQQYLDSFDSEVVYPHLNSLLVECMSLLETPGASPYKAYQEFRAKHPHSKVLELVTSLEASIIANPDVDIAPFYLGNPDPKYNLLAKRFKYRPYQYLHMPYRRQLGKWQEVYATPSSSSCFSPVQRVQILDSLLQRHIHTDALLAQRVLESAFPLHDKTEHDLLKNAWVPWTLSQPLDRIHRYFGSNVAMYFAHLGHATKWLTFAMLAGVLFFVWQQSKYSVGNAAQVWVVPGFGVLMVLWATLWLKHWTRVTSILKLQWGLYSTASSPQPQQVRAVYTGDFIRNPITGQKVKYFQRNARVVRWVVGWGVLLLVAAVALSVQALILYVQATTSRGTSVGIAFALGLCIVGMKHMFNAAIVLLIEYENHRTEVTYQGAYVLKAGVFHAFNSYASLVYMLSQTQLRHINSLYVIYGMEVAVTHVIRVVRLVTQPAAMATGEQQFYQGDANWQASMENHIDLVIRFGYMLGGVVVCPLAPAVSFLDHIMSLRLQATQLMSITRRPRPAVIISTWYSTMMSIVLVGAIVSNSYLVVFVVETFGPASIVSTFDGFCGVLLAMVAARSVLNSVFNDVPTRVNSQLERQAFLVESILNEQPPVPLATMATHSAPMRPTSVSLQSDYSMLSQDDDFDDEVEAEGFV
ncbi:hypothetical protein H257_13057 [Aphanomyces astaci]|uniref:Anoctamin dimerisation domain-containing protein n=1 Tax=Aphanomyces astaci TaxID=112090 RepID=W4FY72_APHAT|nr:hypothetical protein H257_13057 [Aphanomyces astaci]ETV71593.1 hypothetical protein H257_13057 [Aphanomyces astaci]RQM30013.1 hypothetical protein B5M09_001983 [Aphanomyces astaci]|eukprot:XP_009838781.1 hypothetical protein H257_13057 [Aphanomyces astaci]